MSERLRLAGWLVVPAIALAVIVVGLWPRSAAGPDPDARAYALAASLKCPICAGESVAASQTDLAADLRLLIADQIAAGRTDDEIRALFVRNYGEQVLLDPPGGWGAALWAAPLALAVVGGVAIAGLRRRDVTARVEP
jgi:cytochrome c-type biogenesis protein CcmH